jgi:hypothetical protein
MGGKVNFPARAQLNRGAGPIEFQNNHASHTRLSRNHRLPLILDDDSSAKCRQRSDNPIHA